MLSYMMKITFLKKSDAVPKPRTTISTTVPSDEHTIHAYILEYLLSHCTKYKVILYSQLGTKRMALRGVILAQLPLRLRFITTALALHSQVAIELIEFPEAKYMQCDAMHMK